MHYLKCISVAISLLSALSVSAQFSTEKYDQESFLIGTLDEYNGYKRVFVPDIDSSYYQKVDIYEKGEERLARFIDSLFSSQANPGQDIHLTYNTYSQRTRMKSERLSEAIDLYYDWQPSPYKTKEMDTTTMDSLFKSELYKERHCYTGILKKAMFKTNRQKISFLLGAYLKYGRSNPEEEGGAYRIRMFNSPHKASVCVELLKECSFENVEYTIIKGNIPTPYTITFDATPGVQGMIDDAIRLRRYIAQRSAVSIDLGLLGNP